MARLWGEGEEPRVPGPSTVQGRAERTKEDFMRAWWSLSQSTNTSGVLWAVDCHLPGLARLFSTLVIEIWG